MDKSIIGIVGRVDKASDDDKVICVWEPIRTAILQNGGLPLLILPTQNVEYEGMRPIETPRMTEAEKKDLYRIIDMCDGIVMPGGYKWYEFDEVIYEYALQKNMPILGICMGMQIMAAADNGLLDGKPYRPIKNDSPINHKQRGEKYVHKVRIQKESLLYHIIKEELIETKSCHSYHIDRVTDLAISGYAEDGIIEAVEDKNKTFVLGVQWHPETMLSYDKPAQKIWHSFIESTEKGKKS